MIIIVFVISSTAKCYYCYNYEEKTVCRYTPMSPQPQWSHRYCECIMIWELFKLWHDFHNEQLYSTSQADASTVFLSSFSPSASMGTFSAQWQQANHNICYCPHFSIYEIGIIALAPLKKPKNQNKTNNTEKPIIKMIMWKEDNFIIQHQLKLALLSWISCLWCSKPWAGWPDSSKQRRAAATLQLPMAQNIVEGKLQDTVKAPSLL